MKALTLTQPWAGLIITKVKQIENRGWRAHNMIGVPFAIHASREVDEDTVEDLIDMGYPEDPLWRVTSAVLGVAVYRNHVETLSGVERYMRDGVITGDQTKFWQGPVAFILPAASIVQFTEPVPCKGARSFWELPPEADMLCAARLLNVGVDSLKSQGTAQTAISAWKAGGR